MRELIKEIKRKGENTIQSPDSYILACALEKALDKLEVAKDALEFYAHGDKIGITGVCEATEALKKIRGGDVQ